MYDFVRKLYGGRGQKKKWRIRFEPFESKQKRQVAKLALMDEFDERRFVACHKRHCAGALDPRNAMRLLRDNKEHADGLTPLRFVGYARLKDPQGASRTLGVVAEPLARDDDVQGAYAQARQWFRETLTAAGFADLDFDDDGNESRDVEAFYVTPWDDCLHLVVAFRSRSLNAGTAEDEAQRTRAERMARAIASAPPPDGESSEYGGYEAMNAHAFIIFDARIAQRIQTWLGGSSTSGQIRPQAFNDLEHKLLLQYAFFEVEMPDKLDALLPFLRRLFLRLVHEHANKLRFEGTNTEARLSCVDGLFLSSAGQHTVELVDAEGNPRVLEPHWIPHMTFDIGCGKGYPADASLELKISDSSGSGAGATATLLTDARGVGIGISGFAGGADYIPSSTRVSVKTLPDRSGTACLLKAAIDQVKTCQVKGKDRVCGPLTGIDFTRSKSYLVNATLGQSLLRVVPELPEGRHPIQLLTSYVPRPTSAEALVKAPSFAPEAAITEGGKRLGFFPGNLFAFLIGDSAFLQEERGRGGPLSTYFNVLSDLTQEQALTMEGVANSKLVPRDQFLLHGAPAEWGHAASWCHSSLRLEIMLHTVVTHANIAMLAMERVLSQMEPALLSTREIPPEAGAAAKAACQALAAVTTFCGANDKVEALLRALERGASECQKALEPAEAVHRPPLAEPRRLMTEEQAGPVAAVADAEQAQPALNAQLPITARFDHSYTMLIRTRGEIDVALSKARDHEDGILHPSGMVGALRECAERISWAVHVWDHIPAASVPACFPLMRYDGTPQGQLAEAGRVGDSTITLATTGTGSARCAGVADRCSGFGTLSGVQLQVGEGANALVVALKNKPAELSGAGLKVELVRPLRVAVAPGSRVVEAAVLQPTVTRMWKIRGLMSLVSFEHMVEGSVRITPVIKSSQKLSMFGIEGVATGDGSPDAEILCGADGSPPEVIKGGLRLRKGSAALIDYESTVGLPVVVGWDEYKHTSTRADGLFDGHVLSKKKSFAAGDFKAGAQNVFTVVFADGSLAHYAQEAADAGLPDPEYELNFVDPIDQARRGLYSSVAVTTALPQVVHVALQRAQSEAGFTCRLAQTFARVESGSLMRSIVSQVNEMGVSDAASILVLAKRIDSMAQLPGADKELFASSHPGHHRAPAFLDIEVRHGPMHGAMNFIKKLINLIIRIAWGLGGTVLARVVEHINHRGVNCFKKAGHGDPKKRAVATIETVNRVRGEQLRLLEAMLPELLEFFPAGTERELLTYVMPLAFSLSRLVRMGTVRAQKHLYGEANADTLVKYEALMKKTTREVFEAMFRLFPGTRHVEGRVRNNWITRSCAIMWDIVHHYIPHGWPTFDEDPMEQTNALLRELYLRIKNLHELPALKLLENVMLVNHITTEASPLPEQKAKGQKEHEKEHKESGAAELTMIECYSNLLRATRLQPDAPTHNLPLFRSAHANQPAQWTCTHTRRGPSPFASAYVTGYVSPPDARVAAAPGDEPEAMQGVEGDEDDNEGANELTVQPADTQDGQEDTEPDDLESPDGNSPQHIEAAPGSAAENESAEEEAQARAIILRVLHGQSHNGEDDEELEEIL